MEDSEQNKTALDELESFAGQTHRPFWSDQQQYPGSLADRVSHSRKAIYIQDQLDDQCFLVGFHDPKAFGDHELYFGVFFSVSFSKDQSFLVKERDMLDKLNVFQKHRSFLNAVRADFVPAFNQSGFAGLFTLTRWMTNASELEALMALGRMLHRQFNSFS